MKEKEKYLFSEQWENKVRDLLEKSGVSGLYFDTQRCVYTEDCFSGWESFPVSIIDWIKENPCPTISQQDFLIQLAHRIEVLETALAEKGGAR